jgi:bifunctional pyridoxal-dependent enzyme with beta-cystathionase and maltose regulon repressor activities
VNLPEQLLNEGAFLTDLPVDFLNMRGCFHSSYLAYLVITPENPKGSVFSGVKRLQRGRGRA